MKLAGDYQTTARMRAKMRAIPLPDLAGKSVLDLGCDFGAWCQLASEHGAARVVGVDRGRNVRRMGHVDLAERNNAQGWPNCTFVSADIAKEWPDLGSFDVVFCFSLYHHLYGECGNHETIWKYLHDRTAGVLLWEGPLDTTDSVARDRARRHGNYTRAAIIAAAERYFTVEVVGPALHRPHRHVLRCTPKEAEGGDNRGDGLPGSGPGSARIHAEPDRGPAEALRHDAVPGNAEPQDRVAPPGRRVARRTARPERARRAHRPDAVVAHKRADVVQPADRDGGADREGSADADGLPRDSGPDAIERLRRNGPTGPADPSLALCIGGAQCVWDDVLRLEEMIGMPWPGIVIAANDVGSHWPRRLDAWVTLHPGNIAKWIEHREALGNPACPETYSSRRHKNIRHAVPTWGGGASGMLAMSVAVDQLHCRRVVLCGIPMSPTPHFAESKQHMRHRTWGSANGHFRAWKRMDMDRARNVRSMSGQTMDLLGAPTRDWIFDTENQEAA